MNYEILYGNANSMLKVSLDQGEAIKAESGAMVSMHNTIDVDGKLEGGLMGGLGRMLSGEKFFFQTLKASRGFGEVLLSPTSIGSIQPIELDGFKSYMVQKDGFFAGSQNLDISTKAQNLAKGFFSGEGFFILKIGGKGTLFVSSYGAIHPIDIKAGEEIIVDNEHLVAWPDDIAYKIDKASKGWISSFTSGEGLVCKFQGPGRIYIQTRNPSSFAHWIRKFTASK